MARTQRERSQETISSLRAVARDFFVQNGYDVTSLEQIAAAAEVTKGALYHHFASKQALFADIYEREQHTILDAISRAYLREDNAWLGFRAGVQASLTISCRPDVQRITLVDAPGAIGWETMRAIEDRYTMRMLERGLQELIDGGWIESRPIVPLARLLFGGVCELAMGVAHSRHPRKDKLAAAAELDRLLDALATRGRA